MNSIYCPSQIKRLYFWWELQLYRRCSASCWRFADTTGKSISSDDVGLLLFNIIINNRGIENMLLKFMVRIHAQKCYKPLRGHN